MMSLRCCIIDDKQADSEIIASYVRRTPFLELVGTFSSAQEAIRTVLNDRVDLVFLDIHLPQINGLEFAKIIPPTCRIVFVSAYENYALQGYKVNALDFLLKPVEYDDFLNAATKALRYAELLQSASESAPKREFLMVKSDYKLIQIPLDDILFIEGLKDYVKIYLNQDQKSVMTLMSMRQLERYLPSSKFMRIHRSYIINLRHMRLVERMRVVFGPHYLPISESYKAAFTEYVNSISVGTPQVGADE